MTCAHCECENTKKHGKDRYGNPRFRCRECGRTFIDKPADPLGSMRVDFKRAAFVLRLLLEGMSIRATARLTGIDRNTIYDLILTAGENCAKFFQTRVRGVESADIQCDELWSFTACKEKTRVLRGYGEQHGDCYTYIGVCRQSKLILAYQVGRRTFEDADAFAMSLRRAVSGRPQVSTDGFGPYRTVIPVAFRWNVDQGQLIKKFGPTANGVSAQTRYSPAPIVGIEKKRICGHPDMANVCTSHVERMNLSVRMEIRRFTRLTNAFSKSRRHHEAMLALFFAHFNFCRKHSAVKTTPAIAAGIASEPWAIERLLTEAANVAK
ncbi:MAG: IS1 family transposase [Planctomycetaceae bacterium]